MIGAWGKGKPRRWLKQNILDDTMKKKKTLNSQMEVEASEGPTKLDLPRHCSQETD